MSGSSSWRNLRRVMLTTAVVAVVAWLVRPSAGDGTRSVGLPWLAVGISLAAFLSWPMGRAISSAFDPGELSFDRTCPRCRRREVRPLIRRGAGLFEPVLNYRCAACWTTFRDREPPAPGMSPVVDVGPVNPVEIAYLSDPLEEDQIRFLDEAE